MKRLSRAHAPGIIAASTVAALASLVHVVPARAVDDPASAASTSTTVAPRSTTPPRPKKAAVGFVRVVLDEQRVYVYSRTRRLITTMPVSTGTGDTTPVGTFKVFSKSKDAYYAPNPNERMRWMTRFTKGSEGGNIGFHGIPYKVTKAGEVPFPTPLGRAPSSHGCVRMAVSDARWIFHNVTLGMVVSVVRSRS